MPAGTIIGDATVRWQVFQDSECTSAKGIKVQGHHALNMIDNHKYVVIDIEEQGQQPQPTANNAFAILLSPTRLKFYPMPSPAKGDKDNASTTIYKQLCEQLQGSDGLYVETTGHRSKVTALTRSLAAVLVSIDLHHSELLDGDQQRFWEEYKEKRSRNNRSKQPCVDWAQLENRLANLVNQIRCCDEFLRTARWQSLTLQLNSLVDHISP